MHNIILKLFGFLRSCLHFIKILTMFLVLLLILYWIQNLTNSYWNWMKFITPFFDFILDISKKIWSGSIYLYKAKFEFKFVLAFLMLGAFYFIDHCFYLLTYFLEDVYCAGRKMVRKFEADRFNSELERKNTSEQKSLNKYCIFVSTLIKPKFAHREYNVNIEEQNKILIKHLIEKTGISPIKFEEGFLFDFNSFEKIDKILDIFNKLFESKAPIDFIICLQVLDGSKQKGLDQIKTLIDLKIINKITAFADTVYRYSFNKDQGYETSQLGLFQKGNGTFEVHQFIRKN